MLYNSYSVAAKSTSCLEYIPKSLQFSAQNILQLLLETLLLVNGGLPLGSVVFVMASMFASHCIYSGTCISASFKREGKRKAN